MKRNAGPIDRFLRVAIGVALIALTLMGVIGAWGYLGILGIVTGLTGFCPAYAPLGITTCRRPGA